MNRELPTLNVATLRDPGELAFEPRRTSAVEKAVAAVVAALILGAVFL